MRLIDADELRNAMYHEAFETDSDMQKWDGGCWIRYKMFEKAIDSAPTIEAEPIVYCKDCKHNSLKRISGNAFCDLGMNLFQPYDFCSNGERKPGEDPSHPFADSVMMGD